MDMDVPKPKAMDTDALPSLTEEFEELLFCKQCKDIIDEIHCVQQKLCYGCMFNHPGQLDHDICVADWEKKVTVASTKLLRRFHWIFCWKM